MSEEEKVKALTNAMPHDILVNTNWTLYKDSKAKDIEIERLNAELELYKDNQIHLNNQLEQKDKIINEAIEYIENDLSLGINTFGSVYSIGGNEVLKILKGSDKE